MNKPATIEDDEIESLVQLLRENKNVIPKKCKIHPDRTLKNEDYETMAPKKKFGNNQVKLELPSLGYCVIAKTD